MRTLEDLVVRHEPAWPLVAQWIAAATNSVEVLPVDRSSGNASLLRLQVTTRSPMGAIVYETGGLLIDHGWLRILGSGSPRLSRSLPIWNEGKTAARPGTPPPFLLVADDVVGGFYAIDGGGLAGHPGKMHHLAPSALRWENLDCSYTDFIAFVLSGNLEEFYEGLRWPNWIAEIADLSGDRALSVYPFMWAEGPPIAERSRAAVPIEELWRLHQAARQQLGIS